MSAPLAVGSRVRVVADDMHRGYEGVIVEDAGPEHMNPLTVEFDNGITPDAFFRTDELEPL